MTEEVDGDIVWPQSVLSDPVPVNALHIPFDHERRIFCLERKEIHSSSTSTTNRDQKRKNGTTSLFCLALERFLELIFRVSADVKTSRPWTEPRLVQMKDFIHQNLNLDILLQLYHQTFLRPPTQQTKHFLANINIQADYESFCHLHLKKSDAGVTELFFIWWALVNTLTAHRFPDITRVESSMAEKQVGFLANFETTTRKLKFKYNFILESDYLRAFKLNRQLREIEVCAPVSKRILQILTCHCTLRIIVLGDLKQQDSLSETLAQFFASQKESLEEVALNDVGIVSYTDILDSLSKCSKLRSIGLKGTSCQLFLSQKKILPLPQVKDLHLQLPNKEVLLPNVEETFPNVANVRVSGRDILIDEHLEAIESLGTRVVEIKVSVMPSNDQNHEEIMSFCSQVRDINISFQFSHPTLIHNLISTSFDNLRILRLNVERSVLNGDCLTNLFLNTPNVVIMEIMAKEVRNYKVDQLEDLLAKRKIGQQLENLQFCIRNTRAPCIGNVKLLTSFMKNLPRLRKMHCIAWARVVSPKEMLQILNAAEEIHFVVHSAMKATQKGWVSNDGSKIFHTPFI